MECLDDWIAWLDEQMDGLPQEDRRALGLRLAARAAADTLPGIQDPMAHFGYLATLRDSALAQLADLPLFFGSESPARSDVPFSEEREPAPRTLEDVLPTENRSSEQLLGLILAVEYLCRQENPQAAFFRLETSRRRDLLIRAQQPVPAREAIGSK